jgi:hypothetical protein
MSASQTSPHACWHSSARLRWEAFGDGLAGPLQLPRSACRSRCQREGPIKARRRRSDLRWHHDQDDEFNPLSSLHQGNRLAVSGLGGHPLLFKLQPQMLQAHVMQVVQEDAWQLD